jgi:small redox-active disulfide protein 2
MKLVQVLGTGCAKCQKLATLAEKVASDRGLDVRVEKVTSIVDIAEFGVVATPAIAVDGAVVVAGKIPSEDELAQLMS